jgi:hypothetical protein
LRVYAGLSAKGVGIVPTRAKKAGEGLEIVMKKEDELWWCCSPYEAEEIDDLEELKGRLSVANERLPMMAAHIENIKQDIKHLRIELFEEKDTFRSGIEIKRGLVKRIEELEAKHETQTPQA